MAEAIRVNFSKPLPLFALPDGVLLPHAVLPLHIFEARYRQMVEDCLDDVGQVAMATLTAPSSDSDSEFDEQERLRPAACVGQIIQHEALPDGRHNILLHGVCRAKIMGIEGPADDRLYPLVNLQPIERLDEEPPPMTEVRLELRKLLTRPRLKRSMRSVDTVIEWLDRPEIPTHALLELVGFTLIKDNELKYRLLAEADASRRAWLIKRELLGIDHIVERAEGQSHASWPKGVSWN